ncbi:MAG: hypothetical protein ACLUOS_03035 [Odoribacter splanchnicus]
MTPDDIIKLLDATCICGARKLHDPIQHAFAADLMSDVLRLNTEGLLLITGMANPQVIRTAEMADIPFILFVRDKQSRQKCNSWPRKTKSCYCVAVKVCSGYAENCIKPGFFRCIKKTYGIQF